jgi:hypothetical protein
MGRVVSWRLGCVSGSVFVLLFSILGAPARVMSGFFQICFSMRDPCLYVFFFSLFFWFVQGLMHAQIWLFLVVVGVFLLSNSE